MKIKVGNYVEFIDDNMFPVDGFVVGVKGNEVLVKNEDGDIEKYTKEEIKSGIKYIGA